MVMTRDPRNLMWAEACALLERAERLHRQFFEPALTSARGARWEPPVDIFERDEEVWVIAALPGVEPGDILVHVDGDELVIAGRSALPAAVHDARIHRLEIPYGRFERRIGLASARLRLSGHELRHGCLAVRLAKW